MKAAVYHGRNEINCEEVEKPRIGEGEVLVKVAVCGVCPTDIKKIEHGLLEPPRIFGHEIAGVIEEVGAGVRDWKIGERVAVHHHIPCEKCHYCENGNYSMCETYKKTGTTAGFEPSGGGFAEYVRVLPWIVEKGMVRIPEDVSFEEASFVEPVNTCLKGIRRLGIRKNHVVMVFGQGAIGLILIQLAKLEGATTVGIDLMDERLKIARGFGAHHVFNPKEVDLKEEIKKITGGRGADAAVIAAPSNKAIAQAVQAIRNGGKILLFAQTEQGSILEIDASEICRNEKDLIGSYSASVKLQEEVAEIVFRREINVRDLITHKFSLEEAGAAIKLAANPTGNSLKVIIEP